MRRKPRHGADPFERQMELALNPGVFVPDRACFSFVSELEEVAAMIAKLARVRGRLRVRLSGTGLSLLIHSSSDFVKAPRAEVMRVDANVHGSAAGSSGRRPCECPYKCQAPRNE
jgi:hypothetical protein